MRQTTNFKLALGMLLFVSPIVCGQKTATTATPVPASTTLPGLSFVNGDWDLKMPTLPDQIMLCYKLVPTESASQPYLLEPTIIQEANDEKGNPMKVKYKGKTLTGPPCASIDASHPMLQRQRVVLVVDARPLCHKNVKIVDGKPVESTVCNLSRIKALNFNLVAPASTPINPAPLRPSLTTSSVATLNAATNPIYYFQWPIQLTGDTIPTLTVNALYVGPAPGEPRTPNTVYTAGSVVTSVPNDGHFYTALNEGRSSENDATFSRATPATVLDGPNGTSLTWMDLGTGVAPGVAATTIQSWSPGKQFIPGSVIFNPITSHYYAATIGGVSGSTLPAFPVTPPAWSTIAENGTVLTWQYLGNTHPVPASSPAPVFWAPSTVYLVGQIVNGNPGGKDYYVAIVAGQSGTGSPFSSKAPNPGTTVPDSSGAARLTWTDLGYGQPPGVPAASIFAWAPSKQFSTGAVILFPGNSRYYVASVGGVSGPSAPNFPTTPPILIAEAATASQIKWEDVGTTAPSGSPTTVAQWAPSTYYVAGQVISDAKTGHFYLAQVGGQSGGIKPTFPVTEKDVGNGVVADRSIRWQDSGTIPPAAVATAGPTDAQVTLVNETLPQTHSLSYFNIATGFAFSAIRNPSYTSVPMSPGASTYTAQSKVGRSVEPIVLFTTYLPGLALDAESPWKPKNLIPGVSFGFSMSNPGSSFYLGASSEIWRNLQVVGGLNINTKVNTLVPNQVFSMTNPVMTQKTGTGAFFGLTLNMDFIAGFFGSKF